MQQNVDPQEGTSSAAVCPNTKAKQPNPNPRGKNQAPNEVTPSAKPKGENKNKKQKNANPNPSARNPGPNRGLWPHQPNAHFKPNNGHGQHWYNPHLPNNGHGQHWYNPHLPNNGHGQHWYNPHFLPNQGPVHHQPDLRTNGGPSQQQPNPHFIPNDGRRPYSETDEIAALRFHLKEARHMWKTNLYKMSAAHHRATAAKTQNDWLHMQLKCCRENAEKTILELQKQLEQARRNRPEENSTPEVSEAPVQDSNTAVTAAELSVDASTQTTEAPHTDSTEVKTVREAELEVQCKKQQEEIEQLREQLLKTQKNLEEEVAKRKEQEERASCEFVKLKAKLFVSEALHDKNDLEVQNLKDELEKTKAFYLEIVTRKNQENATIQKQLRQTEDEKNILQESLQSLQETRKKEVTEYNVAKQDHSPAQKETMQSSSDKEATVNKAENSPAQVETLQENKQEKEETSAAKPVLPEGKPKKKKKRNWFLRLFT
ncbi:unnamed protein product [Oreochromis niloticus]|nr:unnamed protein product [Mustela putorius furo]